MGKLLLENKRAKVVVIGYKDSVLALRDGQNRFIGEGVRVIASYDGNIVSLVSEAERGLSLL